MMSRIPGILGGICALLMIAMPSLTFANDASEIAAGGLEAGAVTEAPTDAMIDDPADNAADVAEQAPAGESYAEAEAEMPVEVTPDVAEEVASPTPAVVLGEIGYDAQGRAGRIHQVVVGDTLWDISDAYLGTPWVWPSIWTDNADIQNPHLIMPNDRIWISHYEMRRVTDEEADQLLSGIPAQNDMPAAIDSDSGDAPPRIYTVSAAEASGFVTTQELESSASVIESVAPRVMMVQPDEIYIGLGESEVSIGDQFTIYRTDAKIFDPDTNRLLGYHVDVLGWAEVTKPDRETSIVEIRQSDSEIEVGDRLMRRQPATLDIEVLGSADGVEGRISFLPAGRGMMALSDFVYLNRGETDGVNVGNQLNVYREGWTAPERARNERVRIPDRAIADLLVVTARPETSVALITHTIKEIELGDHFRGSSAFEPRPGSIPE